MKNKETIANKLISSPRGLRGLIALLCLAGCSEAPEPTEASMAVEVMSSVADFEEVTAGITRAWTPPTSYALTDGSESIGICFTKDGFDMESEDKEQKMKGYFFRVGSQWRSSVDVSTMTAGSYYLYGYKPHTTGITCTITDLNGSNGAGSQYSKGAILTIGNLPTVHAGDVCVVVGAKNGKDSYEPDADYTVAGLQRGNFEYVAETETEGGTTNNYVFLLFDHLYAALRIGMKVDADYAALRTIKLKELQISTSGTGGATTKTTTATVTLTKNTDGSSPVTDVTFVQTGESGGGTVYQSGAGETLPSASFKYFQGHFMPQNINALVLTSTYDVYDTHGNLIRQGCTAVNTIRLSRFDQQTEFKRGYRYTVNMTIQPTYLYMMSDPDLDNPTVEIES